MLKERKARMQKWDNQGDVVYGRLLKVRQTSFDGKANAEYIVREKSGEIVIFNGTKMINNLLFASDVGKVVQIAYHGEDQAAQSSPKPKLFEVSVDDESAKPTEPNIHGAAITDEDIPF